MFTLPHFSAYVEQIFSQISNKFNNWLHTTNMSSQILAKRAIERNGASACYMWKLQLVTYGSFSLLHVEWSLKSLKGAQLVTCESHHQTLLMTLKVLTCQESQNLKNKAIAADKFNFNSNHIKIIVKEEQVVKHGT